MKEICNRYLEFSFPEKHKLTWAHKLTESRIKAKHLCFRFASGSFALSHSLLQSLCSHPGIQEEMDWLILNLYYERQQLPQGKKQQTLHRTDHPPGNNDLLILTRLLPSSNNKGNSFSRTPWQWSPRPHLAWDCVIIMHTFHLTLILSLFKCKAHVWTPKMGWNVYFASFYCKYMLCQLNLLSLPFTIIHLFIFSIGMSGWTWHVEMLGLGIWPRTPAITSPRILELVS
jgi:hypothetical protein